MWSQDRVTLGSMGGQYLPYHSHVVAELWCTHGSFSVLNMNALFFKPSPLWKPGLPSGCLHLLCLCILPLDILSGSLFEEIFLGFFRLVPVWTGCLLNLLPSCHLEISLQLRPACGFFPPALPMWKGSHVCFLSFLGLSLHLWCTFLGITHSRCLLRHGVWK